MMKPKANPKRQTFKRRGSMKKFMMTVGLLSLMFTLLIGCRSQPDGSQKNQTTEKVSGFSKESEKVTSKAQKGDFVLKFVSEKKVYQPEEKLQIYAMLKYVGEKPKIKVYHGMSPIAFTQVVEKNRGITIRGAQLLPLKSTTLQKGEWYKQPYSKSGGYGSNTPHADFIKKFLKGEGFPEGNYDITAAAGFFIKKGGVEKNFNFSTKINVKVK